MHVDDRPRGPHPSPGGDRPGSPEPRHRPPRGHRLLPVVAATAVGSAGLAAGGTGGPLLVAELTDSTSWAGAPIAALVAGSGLGALVSSGMALRWGRRRAVATGYLAGAAGALGCVVAVARDDLVLVLAATVVLGWGNAAVFLSRYAVVDRDPGSRGRALGTVLGATAVGAVIGPTVLGPSGAAAAAAGVPSTAGLHLLAAACFTVAAVVIGVGRSDPLPVRATTRAERRQALRHRPTRVSLTVLAVANGAMVGVMTVVPVRLHHVGHGLVATGVVVSVHVAAMFGPAPLLGVLADRHGPAVVSRWGLLLIALSSAPLAAAPHDGTGVVTVLLVGVGLGWCASVTASSLRLVASAPVAVRPSVEGIGEAVMAAGAAVGALTAAALSAVSFGALCGLLTLACTAAAVVLARRPPGGATREGC